MFKIKTRHLAYGIIASIVFPNLVSAHPISFKDGYGIMPTYTKDRQELELNYTFEQDKAIAFNSINIKHDGDEALFLLPQFNYKLYRKNELESQMNLYLSVGAGNVHYQSDDRLTSLFALQADYETRRFYTLMHAESLQSEGGDADFAHLRYRIGFAPYLADFEELNTWLILQAEFTPDMDDEFTVTPLVRFFYSNYLIEVGSSTRGELFVAGIFHF